MAIIRLPKQRNYTAIARELAQNNDLTYEARGLMLYLLSHGDGWTPMADDIERSGGREGIGRIQRRRIIAELEREGYMTYHRVQGDRGHWGWEIQVHEEPVAPEERTHEHGKKTPDQTDQETSEGSVFRRSDNPPVGFTASRKTDPSYMNRKVPNSDREKKEGKASQPFSPNDDFSDPLPDERLKAELSKICGCAPVNGAALKIESAAIRIAAIGGTVELLRAYVQAESNRTFKIAFIADDFGAWLAMRTRNGTASNGPSAIQYCPECAGSKRVRIATDGKWRYSTCTECNGTGRKEER